MPPHDQAQGHQFAEHSFSILPFLGGFLVLAVLLTLAALYLKRQGKLTLPTFGPRTAPEDEAKRILARRFATGDISTEDFMERSSILNWTPGNDTQLRLPRKVGR